jgi:hypothetical protein
MIPSARHVGANRQNGNLVIVVPKNERIVREKEQAESDDKRARRDCTSKISEGEW